MPISELKMLQFCALGLEHSCKERSYPLVESSGYVFDPCKRCIGILYTLYLSNYEHAAPPGQITTLSNGTCVFLGSDEPEREVAKGEPGIWRSGFAVSNLPNSTVSSVHAGLVARDSSSQWMLLTCMLTKWHPLNEWHLPKQVPSITEGSGGSCTSHGPLYHLDEPD